MHPFQDQLLIAPVRADSEQGCIEENQGCVFGHTLAFYALVGFVSSKSEARHLSVPSRDSVAGKDPFCPPTLLEHI